MERPRRTSGDVAHGIAKAGLGSIPILGAAATELFQHFIQPPLEKRRDEWMASVGERLDRIERDSGNTIQDLQNDEAFVDTVLQATHVAMRNGQAEKRDALRNAIYNSAMPSAPAESERQMFLMLIDQFTVWHLKILTLFDDPPGWFQKAGRAPPEYTISGSLNQLLLDAYPELRDKEEFYTQVWKDLYDRGLTNTSGLMTMMTGSGVLVSRTSERGLQFLRFISHELPERRSE